MLSLTEATLEDKTHNDPFYYGNTPQLVQEKKKTQTVDTFLMHSLSSGDKLLCGGSLREERCSECTSESYQTHRING